MTTSEARKEIMEYMRREIIGPAPGFPAIQVNKEEMLRPQDPPRLRYSAGILFPMRSEQVGQEDNDEKELGEFEVGPAEDAGEPSTAEKTELADSGNPIDQQPETDFDLNLANQYLPSAMGLSALIRIPKQLVVKIDAARYEKCTVPGFGKSKNNMDSTSWAWLRKPIITTVVFDSADLLGKSVISLEKNVEIAESNSKLAVNIVSRPREEEDLRLVTITLINRNESPRASSDELCFFQCRLDVTSLDSSGCFLEYPDRQFAEEPEEKALRFLYRKKKVFGVGHGCACDWSEQASGGCTSIWTESLPSYELKPIVHAELKNVSLSMKTLSDGGSEALRLCETLALSYEDWITEQKAKLADSTEVPPEFVDVAKANLTACDKCLARMMKGIELLRNESVVRRAFGLANEAMYRQQSHYELASSKVRQWVTKEGKLQVPESYKEPDYARKAAAWRPFQLAFLLMNLESAANPDSKDRKVVDLIWFPTGGGKTEAYLGLSAFTIFLRRLRNSYDAGTAVLMRYTLRLLTTQQFQRAASLICACDYIRRSRSDELGAAPISIGLWVGMGVTPNDHQDAVTSLNRLYESPNENRFVVLACPWCGAEMGPVRSGNNWKVKGYFKVRKPSRVVFRCEDPQCPFSTEPGLPLEVVDEAIYEDPPTLVIGTVDKFAMLPWRPKARSLFGLSHNYSPPDLIIQDELHLISGPLGSMVAHYEMAIDALCCATTDVSPKIVASTATISRAEEQIIALYGGRSSFLFPPQGLEVGNSFFAEESETKLGRRYVGIFASAVPSHVTAQIRVISALLQAAKSIPLKDPQSLDPFWTLMVYFNSIRELGHAATLIRADIREYMNAMWDRQGLTKGINPDAIRERRFINRDLELTSRIQGNQIPKILAELFNNFRGDKDYEVVDICLATNMIQVGLDVPRLSLMTVVGQPKTTAEYIQASSRVGRSEPGLVFTIYNPARPRDRSHFEHFRAYHQSIYRFVEPTSVTPFARPVIERALHAIVVALIRMLGGESLAQRPNAPLPDDDLIDRIRAIVAKRVSEVDKQQVDAALERLNYVMAEWKSVPPSKYGDFSPPDPRNP